MFCEINANRTIYLQWSLLVILHAIHVAQKKKPKVSWTVLRAIDKHGKLSNDSRCHAFTFGFSFYLFNLNNLAHRIRIPITEFHICLPFAFRMQFVNSICSIDIINKFILVWIRLVVTYSILTTNFIILLHLCTYNGCVYWRSPPIYISISLSLSRVPFPSLTTYLSLCYVSTGMYLTIFSI